MEFVLRNTREFGEIQTSIKTIYYAYVRFLLEFGTLVETGKIIIKRMQHQFLKILYYKIFYCYPYDIPLTNSYGVSK